MVWSEKLALGSLCINHQIFKTAPSWRIERPKGAWLIVFYKLSCHLWKVRCFIIVFKKKFLSFLLWLRVCLFKLYSPLDTDIDLTCCILRSRVIINVYNFNFRIILLMIFYCVISDYSIKTKIKTIVLKRGEGNWHNVWHTAQLCR